MLTELRISLILLLCLTVLSASCMKNVNKLLLVNDVKPNKLFIHKNPKVGDYSVVQGSGDISYSAVQGSGVIGIKKVIAVSSDSVKVRWESTAYPDLIAEWVLDFDGNVKKVDMIDAAKNNERIPCRIFNPGDFGYVELVKLTKEQLEVEMKSAPLEVKKVALNYKHELEGYKLNPTGGGYYSIYLIDNNVKFLIVSSFLVIYNQLYSYEKIIDSGNKK